MEKKVYKFSFNGRQNGAIGIFYNISDEYEATSISEAVSMLFVDYEHFKNLKLNGKPFNVENKHFIETDYKGKGMNRK